LVRKYWTPKPFVRPTQHAEALNEEAADILAETEQESSVEEDANELQTAAV
jgi:glutathione-regulated potassium-efflux system protein KefC